MEKKRERNSHGNGESFCLTTQNWDFRQKLSAFDPMTGRE
jgi:hypothetical protein